MKKIALSLIVAFLQSNDNNAVSNKYNTLNGIPVTFENLESLAPKAPQEAIDAARSLLKSEEFLLNVVMQVGAESKVLDNKKKARETITGLGYRELNPNEDGCNYIIKTNNDPWIMKISGHVNRYHNYKADHNFHFSQKLPTEVIDLLPFDSNKQLIKTVQTASRVFHAERLREFFNRNCAICNDIDVVKEYLVHVPGRPETIDDKNIVVMSEYIDGLKPLNTIEDRNKIVSPAQAVCMWAGMQYAGLWSASDIHFDEIHKKYYFVDTEQPNTTKSSQIFNNDIKRTEYNIDEEGAPALINLFGANSIQASIINEAKKLGKTLVFDPEALTAFIKQQETENNNG